MPSSTAIARFRRPDSRFHGLGFGGSVLRWAAWTLALLTLCLVGFGCDGDSAQSTRYHCPMHPTYVSDRPGDCPICGMRLVAMTPSATGGSSHAPASASAAPATSATSASAASAATSASAVTSATSDAKPHYTCPMHPEIVQDGPGRCPKCNMALEPSGSSIVSTTTAAVPGRVPIELDARGLELAGVRTALAEQRKLNRSIRALGTVVPDETRVRHVHTKVSGWVERLFVSFTGQPVTKGQPLLTLYSQDLLASQEEFLRVKQASAEAEASAIPEARRAAAAMVEAARRRLTLFDVPEAFLTELERSGTAQRTVTLLAPSSGIVTTKSVFEGQAVEPGMELFTITDLSRIWVDVDFYENEASAAVVGREVKLTLPSQPGVELTGKIRFVYPSLSPETRTLRARLSFPNPKLALKLSMYVNVAVPVEASLGVVVPDSAIIDTGLRKLVFVNTVANRFEPRLVELGVRSDGEAELRSGVVAGERVVVKANFLIDSESRLRAALAASATTGSAP